MIPGLERSPGGGKGSPLQYSGLENSMDYIAWGRKESDMAERLSLSLRGSSSRGNEKETGVTYTLKEGSAARGRLLETESEVTDDFFPFL